MLVILGLLMIMNDVSCNVNGKVFVNYFKFNILIIVLGKYVFFLFLVV